MLKKSFEQPASQLPILPVDAILYFRCFYFSLYQSGIFQLFQMLGHSCFGYREFFVYIAKIAGGTIGEKLKYRDTCRMSHCFSKAGKLLLGITNFI